MLVRSGGPRRCACRADPTGEACCVWRGPASADRQLQLQLQSNMLIYGIRCGCPGKRCVNAPTRDPADGELHSQRRVPHADAAALALNGPRSLGNIVLDSRYFESREHQHVSLARCDVLSSLRRAVWAFQRRDYSSASASGSSGLREGEARRASKNSGGDNSSRSGPSPS